MSKGMKTILSNVRVAAEYAAAFEMLYGYKPDINYHNGWFSVGKWPAIHKCRAKELAFMASNLRRQSA